MVSPRNTAVISISTSIRCYIALAEQGYLRRNQKYATDALVQEYEAMFPMILCEKYGSKLAYNRSHSKTEKNTLSHAFLSRITYVTISNKRHRTTKINFSKKNAFKVCCFEIFWILCLIFLMKILLNFLKISQKFFDGVLITFLIFLKN